jgi:hypothetical protein
MLCFGGDARVTLKVESLLRTGPYFRKLIFTGVGM